MESAWISKIVGDSQQYNQIPNPFRKEKSEGPITYAVNVIKSLRWPGSITIAKGGKFTNIYIGNCQKRADSSFNPTEPPEVQRDPVDSTEQPEPTPFNEPAAVVEKQADLAEEEQNE